MRVRFKNCKINRQQVCGYQQGNLIVINLMKGNILNTYIHEVLHYRHPDWSHKQVYRETAKRMRKLNCQQRLHLYRRMFCPRR